MRFNLRKSCKHFCYKVTSKLLATRNFDTGSYLQIFLKQVPSKCLATHIWEFDSSKLQKSGRVKLIISWPWWSLNEMFQKRISILLIRQLKYYTTYNLSCFDSLCTVFWLFIQNIIWTYCAPSELISNQMSRLDASCNLTKADLKTDASITLKQSVTVCLVYHEKNSRFPNEKWELCL